MSGVSSSQTEYPKTWGKHGVINSDPVRVSFMVLRQNDTPWFVASVLVQDKTPAASVLSSPLPPTRFDSELEAVEAIRDGVATVYPAIESSFITERLGDHWS